MALLTAEERSLAQVFLTEPGLIRLNGPAELIKLGLVEMVTKFSRSEARGSKDFETVARKLWVPAAGAVGIVEMMNRWGQIKDFTRAVVVNAVANDWPTFNLAPEERNAILALGGRAWLSR